MRVIFTDGGNSVVHFLMGGLAKRASIIGVAFIAYQLATLDENTVIDIAEFAVGWLVL